ncbi:MAG: lipopolysaccharide kinase InaA family protein [Planctomycetota bacterium]
MTARVLKQDGLGRTVLVDDARGPRVRREACGGRWPGSAVLARFLLRRERRALAALAGMAGVPALVADEPATGHALARTYVAGEPLWAATALPRDYFDLLGALVAALHARGVCHNDLHKENNILVQPDGRPALIDFQLATVHDRRGRTFAARSREDRRPVDKHRRRYERAGVLTAADREARSRLASAWLRLGKPVWNRLRTALGVRRPEPRRPRGGPWPEWTPPVGPLP